MASGEERKFSPAAFAWGTKRPSRSAAVASKHSEGITFPGKMSANAVPAWIGAPPCVATAALQPGRLFRTPATVGSFNVPANAGDEEKSPERSASVGTVTGSEAIPCRSLRPSYDKKKKSLFLRI